MSIKEHDPALYRQMSQPFDDHDAANDAAKAFFDEVAAARVKHRIADVVVLVQMPIMTDGEETHGGCSLRLGDRSNVLPMLAREYGAERARHDDTLALLISAARRGEKRKP